MSGLFLNFFECRLKNESMTINYLPYSDYSTREQYFELRDSHKELSFYRRDDRIYYWKLEEEAVDDLDGESISIKAGENPRILMKIIEMAIVTWFRKKLPLYSTFKNKHSHIWEIVSTQDLLNSSIEGLAVYRRIKFNTYFFKPDQRILFGFVMSANVKNRFTWIRQDFENHGIETNGLKGKEDIIFANRENIKHFVTATGVKELYEQKIREVNSNENTFKVIKDTFDWLVKYKSHIYLPDKNEFSEFSMKYLPYENQKIKQEVMSKPKRYYYDEVPPDGRRLYYNEQVRRYKPVSFEVFENEIVKIGVLCPKEYEGTVKRFINRVEHTFKSDFHIKEVSFTFRYPESLFLKSYKEHLYDDSFMQSDLAIVIVDESHKKLPPNKSPYFVCKAKCLGREIPTQDVLVKNIKNFNQATINNITLNIYAKLGGTVWTLQEEEARKDELIIGIGSTTNEEGKLELGIAQIFHSDGRYLVGNCVPLSTIKNYTKNLEDYLLKALNKVIHDHININHEFKLIFHLFKSAGKEHEIQAVTNVIGHLNQFTFKYALVHLGYGHNFRLFFNDGRNKIRKGSYIRLDFHNALLHFVEESFLPLRIQLDKRSTYKDLYDISKQVYWFSHLSYKSYTPPKKTVTIMYPSLMANLTEKLKSVEAWDYECLSKVSEKLWFI